MMDRISGSMCVPGVEVIVCAVALFAACGDDDGAASGPLCESSSIASALAAAGDGDVVTLGACRIEGTFVVPSGATLRGAGVGATTLVGAGDAVVTLTPSDVTPTTIADLSIESSGSLGVVARGAGGAIVRAVSVRATLGNALGASDLTTLLLADVIATGPVTRETLAALPGSPSNATTAMRGVVLMNVARAELTDVSVTGFAATGVYADGGSLSWRGGGVNEAYGTGVLVHRGEAVLTDLALSETLQRDGEDTFALVIANGATVESTGLDVSSNASFGILQSEARARHAGLIASRNEGPALWVQRSDDVEITGASELRDNRLAGVVLTSVARARITGATIAGTTIATRVSDTMTALRVGDGVQVLDSVSDVVLDALRLEANARVGVLVDGGGASIDGVALTDVSVSGSGDALGVIAQASIAGPDWDSGVTRDAVTAANDAMFSGLLDVVSIAGPDWAPPAAADLDR